MEASKTLNYKSLVAIGTTAAVSAFFIYRYSMILKSGIETANQFSAFVRPITFFKDGITGGPETEVRRALRNATPKSVINTLKAFASADDIKG